MGDTAITLLLQIPLAGVVVYVVWLFLQYMRQTQQEMMAFIKQQEISNHDFLREQREASNEATARLAEEIKATRESVGEIRGILLGQREARHERVR